jgi:hypothetical protein
MNQKRQARREVKRARQRWTPGPDRRVGRGRVRLIFCCSLLAVFGVFVFGGVWVSHDSGQTSYVTCRVHPGAKKFTCTTTVMPGSAGSHP